MAITTMDGVIAAMPGQVINVSRLMSGAAKTASTSWYSLWGSTAATGFPGAGTYPGASTTWTVPTSSTAGALPFTNPGAGNSYLARFGANSSVGGVLMLYDRLAHTGDITPAASTQNLTTTALTRPDANGDEVELWWEWTTVSTATASNFTCSYTNQAGTAAQTTQTLAGQTVSVIGQLQPFRLAAGDSGVRTVESFTGSGAIGGTGMLVLMRRLAVSPIFFASQLHNADLFELGMPRIYNSACLSLVWYPLATTAAQLNANVQIIQG